MQFTVETWDPVYGTPSEVSELDEAAEKVELEVEYELDDWAPVTPEESTPPPATGVFIDGVRRFDAHVWLGDEEDGLPSRGVCATVAAGAVRCQEGEEAVIDLIHIERGLHTSSQVTDDIELANLSETYKIRPVSYTHLTLPTICSV